MRDSLKQRHLRSGQFWPGPDRLYAHVNPCRGLCENLVCTSVASLTATVIQRYFHRLFFFSSTQIYTDQKSKRWIVRTPSASSSTIWGQVENQKYEDPKDGQSTAIMLSPVRTYNGGVEGGGSHFQVLLRYSRWLPCHYLGMPPEAAEACLSLSSARTFPGIFLTGAPCQPDL